MKKLVLVLVASLTLMACGNKPKEPTSQVLSCETTIDGLGFEMLTAANITITDKKLTVVDMTVSLPYSLMGLTYDSAKLIDEKEFASLMSELMADELGEDSGMELDVKLTEDSMVMNYNMNVEQFIDTGFVKESDVNKEIDINELKTTLEQDGGTCTIK